MPKSQSSRSETKTRHNPLAEAYSPSQPLKQKAGKKRKITQANGEDNVIDSKASRRILSIGQELIDEDDAERKASEPNPAFDFGARLAGQLPQDEDDDQGVFEDEDDAAWGSEEEVIEEIELDPNDQDIFNRFHPSNTTTDQDLANLFNPTTTTNFDPTESAQGTNLADLILEKIAAHEALTASAGAANGPNTNDHITGGGPSFPEDEPPLPPKVIEVYTTIGVLLSRHRSGPLPKPFKVIPSLPAHQIPQLIYLTKPESWTPYVYYQATRLFISAPPSTAQPFLTTILLPKVRDEIQETKKLHIHLYSALKKSLYKPACFFKGILFPLLDEGTCTLREAQIIASVVARVSVPVLHSAAALLRLCDIAAEQFSTRKEDGGGSSTNFFIRTLLEKKYALPYKVVDALVFHFLRFKSVDAIPTDTNASALPSRAMAIQAAGDNIGLPVLWHQSLLAFANTYKNDITEDQREALLDLVNAKGHYQIGPEVRRQLLAGRGRGVPEFVENVDVVGGDDTMMAGMEGAGRGAGGDFSFGKAAELLGGGMGNGNQSAGDAMVVG